MIDAEVLDNDPIFDQSYAEIERLRDEKNAAWDSAEYNAQRARVAEAAIGKLREYARHKPICYWWQGPKASPTPCDCGYDELMKELEESK